jgi:class 3 adenylate cyclase
MRDDDHQSDTSKHWAAAPDEPTRKQDEHETLALRAKVEKTEAPNAGDRIANRYCLERKLGSGGMGDVYLALDELHGRRVALKLLRRQVAGNLVVVNRFRREARITAQLSNPHAVKVYDFGQAADGSLYLAMECLEGEAMNSLLTRENHLPPQQVIDIAVDLLQVLAEAHGYGIIHRDIKPANIFLAKQPLAGPVIVKLLDFGIAKLRDLEATELTASGDVWGTPRYMSPEQARGKTVDQRSDLYSLGVLMYKALTGTFPHEATNAAEMAFALLNDVTESPDKRRPDLGISPELGKVVLRALAREPDARYPSALAMAADLRAISEASQVVVTHRSLQATWFVRTAAMIPLVFTLACMLEVPFVLRNPFPGFALESGLLVSAIVEESWPGFKQDLQPYDIVLAVDGEPVHTGRDVRTRLSHIPLGTPVEYTLQRGDRIFQANVPVSVVSPLILLKHYGSALLSGLMFCIVGAVVAWRRPHSRDTHALLAFTTAMGILLGSTLDLDHGYFFPWLWRLALGMTGTSMMHLALTYPARWAPLHRKTWRIVALHIPAVVLFAVWQLAVNRPAIAVICMQVASQLFALGGLVLFGRLLYTRLRGATLPIRQSARVLLWGVGVALLPGIAISAAPVAFGVRSAWLSGMTWLAITALAFFPALVAYQLVRGELFDVDVALSAVVRGFCKLALFMVVFLIPALAIAAVCRAFETGPIPQMVLGVFTGIATITLVAEKLERGLRWLFDRRSDVNSAAALDQFAAATQGAESKTEVLEALSDLIQRIFSPNTLQLFERGQGDQFWDILGDTHQSMRSSTGQRDIDSAATGVLDVPKSGDSVERIRERLTRVGHWDAHAYLVLPFVGAHENALPNVAPSSVLVIGTRADGRAYSSFHVALTAGLIRLAVVRIQAIEERLLAQRRILQDRCLGPERKALSGVDSEIALEAPARGLAATLLLRFSGLDKASECLSPRQFKQMMDELYEAAAHAALDQGGTLHSVRGDEMLFGFGALGVERGSADLCAIAAALEQVKRLQVTIGRYQVPWVRVRCGLSRGLVTVGVFGASFRQDCLLIGAAIREATEIINAARDGEVVVDEDLAKFVEIVKAPYIVEPRNGLVRGAGAIRRAV